MQMIQARFHVPWDDFDYEDWVHKCGGKFLKVEPRTDYGFDVHIEGDPTVIEQFAQELGWGPETN